MNAIVVVFVSRRDDKILQRTLEVIELEGKSGNAPITRPPALLDNAQAAPPLWTWFVENPRSRFVQTA